MLKLNRGSALRTLVGVRFTLGAISWAAPALLHRSMMINGRTENATAYPLRLFGARDAFSGAALVLTAGKQRQRMVVLNVAADLADVAASGLAGITGSVSRRGAALCTVACLVGASLGAAALGRGPLAEPEQPD